MRERTAMIEAELDVQTEAVYGRAAILELPL
jgi:hypothetical protein